MRLYYNNERQNAKAAGYPFSIEVKNCDDLRKAVSHDHTQLVRRAVRYRWSRLRLNRFGPVRESISIL